MLNVAKINKEIILLMVLKTSQYKFAFIDFYFFSKIKNSLTRKLRKISTTFLFPNKHLIW